MKSLTFINVRVSVAIAALVLLGNGWLGAAEKAGQAREVSGGVRSPSAGEWTDLTNAPRKIIGTWQGGRHRTQYFADGTFVTDPHLVPDPPRVRWQIQGDRLVQFFAHNTVTHQILSLDGKSLVIRNVAGETFRLTRLH